MLGYQLKGSSPASGFYEGFVSNSPAVQSTHQNSEQYSPFQKPFERIILISGVLAVALSLLSTFLGREFASEFRPAGRFIAKILLFNSGHTVFTFIFLLGTLEYRKFIRVSLQRHRAWIILGVLLVPILLLIRLAQYSLIQADSDYLFIPLAVLNCVRANHVMAQIYGISKLFGRCACEKEEKNKKLVFKFLIASYSILIPIFYFYSRHPRHLAVPFTIFFSGIVVTILGSAMLSEKSFVSHRSIYLLRLLCIPMLFWSWIPHLLLSACHGVEYLGITNTIVTRGQSVFKRKIAWYLIVSGVIFYIFFSLPYVMPSLFFKPFNEVLGNQFLVTVLIAYYLIEFTHYYLDRYIFRFSDSLVRLHTLSLFRFKNSK